jgi:hypothetical protein
VRAVLTTPMPATQQFFDAAAEDPGDGGRCGAVSPTIQWSPMSRLQARFFFYRLK